MIRSRMALSPRPCRPQRLAPRVRASREPGLNRAVASLFPFHWPFDTARGGLMSRSPNRASSQKELGSKFDVYVSLSPSAMAKIREPNHLQALRSGFKAMHCLGVDGVVVHVWWGLVEAEAPQQYDWELYNSFFTLISECSLQVKPFFCFHSCERVGLPNWVMELGRATPDIFFADQHSVRSHDCLSFGVDNVRVLEGRSGLQIYSDFFSSFSHHFQHLLGSQISECIVGLGPNGELRYPSYPLERWEYPGVGSFQSYDRYMISGLRAAALEVGRPEFGQEGGPHDAGSYCSWPMYTAFFRDDGGWCRDYGRFFLQWYSETLIMHGREVLHEAQRVLQNTTLQHECIRITAKLPAVHWWYNTTSHAAELAAGLYNTCNRDGYVPVFRMLAEVGAGVQLGCAELANSEQAPEAMSSPENMLNHMRVAASSQGVSHIGLENCHVRFDKAALGQLESSMMGHLRYAEVAVPNAQALTINCLCDDMFAPSNWGNFKAFMSRLRTATLEAGCPPAPVGVQ